MSDELARLLEAIHAAPEDDAPRLVYADALIERGDPRGDFIVRQCHGDAAPALLARYAQRWLEGLAPLLARYTFERGFLATAHFAPSPELGALGRAIGRPIWATVRELQGPAKIAIDPVMRALRVLSVGHELDHWRELLAGTPRPIEELSYRPYVTEEWDHGGDITATPQSGGQWMRMYLQDELVALASCTALPALRRLSLSGMSIEKLAEVLRGPIVDRMTVTWMSGPLAVSITGGLATITVEVPAVAGYVVVELVHALPANLGIALVADPHFADRAIVERAVGARLVVA